MIIYLAGPMSGHEGWNFAAFDAHASALRAQGHEVHSPADISRRWGIDGTREPTAAETYSVLLDDIHTLLGCDALAAMPGWETSRGAKLEVRVATRAGLRLIYLE